MWKATVLVALAAFGLIEGCAYKDFECTDYNVIEQHPDYEVRSYPDITWASTTEKIGFRRIGQYEAFLRLFRYINGHNVIGQKIEMTVPVRMQVTGSGNETVFSVSFLMPKQFKDKTPVPRDDRVKIVRQGQTKYAVRIFKGYIWRQSRWEEEAEKLAQTVKDDDRVVKTSYYMVGYDAPFERFDRRNEIWMVKNN